MVQEGARFQPLHADAAAALEEDDDAPAPEDYIVQVGELEGDEVEDAGVEDDGEPPAWAVLEERLAATRATHRRHETDTGSPEFQVAGMTERIFYLTKHMQTHPKDFSTRRGLVALVNKRRRLLNYLVKEDVQRYKDVVASLGIRHKASGAVRSKEDKYSRYPGQQAIKKHLVKKK
jgi:small subunit ribosomal protein S15